MQAWFVKYIHRMNKALEDKHLPDTSSGFVCLQMLGSV